MKDMALAFLMKRTEAKACFSSIPWDCLRLIVSFLPLNDLVKPPVDKNHPK